MLMMGLSFTFPSLSVAMVPCLVVSGLCYGLGVGPASYILMSSLFTQHMKTTGMVTGQVVRALANTVQLKVHILGSVLVFNQLLSISFRSIRS